MLQKTTLFPEFVTASEEAINELQGTMISLPLGKSNDLIAISRASVPFPTPTQYFTF